MADIVFLNAPGDETYVQQLKAQARAAGLSVWSISDTVPGINHAQALSDNINAAKVIVPLGDADFISCKTSGGKDFVDIVREAATRPLNPKPIRVLNLRPCMIEALRTPNSTVYPDAANPITSIRDRAGQEAAMNQFIRNIAAEAPGLQAGPPIPQYPIKPATPLVDENFDPFRPIGGSGAETDRYETFRTYQEGKAQEKLASSLQNLPPETMENIQSIQQGQQFPASNVTQAPQSASPVPQGPPRVHMISLEGDITDEMAKAFHAHSIMKQRTGKVIYSHSGSAGMTEESERKVISNATVVMVGVSSKAIADSGFMEKVRLAQNAGKTIIPVICSRTDLDGTGLEDKRPVPELNGKTLEDYKREGKLDLAFAGDGRYKKGVVGDVMKTAGVPESPSRGRFR